MDHTVNVRVLLEDLLHRALVGDVERVEERALAADQLDPIHAFLGRVVETVDNDDLVAGLQERESSERANVAAPSGVAEGQRLARQAAK